MFGRRILIFAPHPVVEVAACATAVDRARNQGAEVSALYLTNGCLVPDSWGPWRRRPRIDNAARRRAEAEAAAIALGLTPLGWPPRAISHLWRELPQVHAEMQAAIEAWAPDQIWLPAYEGHSPDHDALNALGQPFTDQLSVLEFAELNFLGGKARTHRFPFPDGSEQTIILDPRERDRKRELLRLYASEPSSLNEVDLAKECYRPLAVYNFAEPPHPGRLWYARHRWNPFHRGNIGFESPAKVSQAIVDYFEECWTNPPMTS